MTQLTITPPTPAALTDDALLDRYVALDAERTTIAHYMARDLGPRPATGIPQTHPEYNRLLDVITMFFQVKAEAVRRGLL